MKPNCGPKLTCGAAQACLYYVPSSCTHCHHMSPQATGHRCVGSQGGGGLDQAMTKAFDGMTSDNLVPYIVKPTVSKDNLYTDRDRIREKKGSLNESYYCNGAGQNATTHPGCREVGKDCINWREDPAVAGTMGYSQGADLWECIPNVLNVTQGGDPLSADDLTPSRGFDPGTRKPTGLYINRDKIREIIKKEIKRIKRK